MAEFFDVGQSRSIPWKRRPQAALLLDASKNPRRGFDAIMIGEPQRAFYGNQYGLTFPVFVHYNMQLWVPEVGGMIDPDSEARDLVMSVFGGMSKGERTGQDPCSLRDSRSGAGGRPRDRSSGSPTARSASSSSMSQ